MIFNRAVTQLPDRSHALPGRATRGFEVGGTHLALGTPVETEAPDGFAVAVVGLGCFWGEEKTFWSVPGVWSTSVGYAGGVTPNPTYEEVCSKRTGHAEVVRIIFDPAKLAYTDLLKVFWENHDPTQVMRQGNDRGSNYRSIILTTTPEQQSAAEASRDHYQKQLTAQGYGEIATSIVPLEAYYYAEAFHQQYLFREPNGYCPLHATGIKFDS